MHRLQRIFVSALVAVTLVTAMAFAPPTASRIVPLSDVELAATWGGVYGGRIGQENGGILELSCGAEDLWPSGAPPLWDNKSGTAVRDCDVENRPHFLPRYASAEDVSVVVGGVITKLTGTGGTPRIRVFVNGSASAFATVPCSPRTDYPTGTAFGINGNPNRDVNSWACPDNIGLGNHYGVTISLANAGLRPGLNVVQAVTEGAVGVDDAAQDQEIRFFCVGEDDCLPARIELRPVANGALNEFGYPPVPGNPPHWQLVNDYPDPSDPTHTGTCTLVFATFVSQTTTGTAHELFQMGGAIPSGLTFTSCTLKTHLKGAADCDFSPSYDAHLVVRNSGGAQSDGPALNVHGADLVLYSRTMTTNPFTGTSWTSSNLVGIQAGIKNTAPASVEFGDLVMECEF